MRLVSKVAFFVFLPLVSYLLAMEVPQEKEVDSMKAAKKEAKRLGKESNRKLVSILEDLFENKSALVSQDDLLPQNEKGKRFDIESAEARMDTHVLSPFERELEKTVQEASKKQQFEGTETFFSGATAILKDPESQMGIESYEVREVPSREVFEACIEEGSFESFADQKRTIRVIPEKKQTEVTCLGHQKEKEFFWESDAEAQEKEWKDTLSKDTSLKSYHVCIDKGGIFKDYRVKKKWTHQDGVSCSSSETHEKILQERKEEDIWEAESLEVLSYLEESPKCRLIFSTPLDGPNSQIIAGKSVSRDFWRRRLFFSCSGEENPKCQAIRKQGGMIVSKECIKKAPHGECELWEKKYKTGGQTSFIKRDVYFKEDSIWGIGEFEEAAELSSDFGDAVSKLAAISDLKGNTEIENKDILKAGVFRGDSLKCTKSFAKDLLYDCCGDLAGFATDIGLAGCSSAEKDLYQKRKDGKCHYIGTRSTKMGLEKEKVYCCFPTKLARIIQEEGRAQLHLEWGDEESPKCQGLSLEEIKQLNFDAMDFSDFILEMHQKIDQETLRKKLQNHVQKFSQTSGESATRPLIQKEQEKLLEGGSYE